MKSGGAICFSLFVSFVVNLPSLQEGNRHVHRRI